MRCGCGWMPSWMHGDDANREEKGRGTKGERRYVSANWFRTEVRPSSPLGRGGFADGMDACSTHLNHGHS